MSRPRSHPSVACAVLVLAAVGCRVSTPEPLPDAARETGVTLLASPASLVIRPGGNGRITFLARDQSQQPLAYYPVDFGIVADVVAGDQDTAGARLSTLHGLTDLGGETTVEVIVGPLANQHRPVAFWVRASSPGAPIAQAYILVTTNAYSVEILPVPADDLIGFGQVVATSLYFYDNAACADLDLYDIGSSLTQARAPQRVPANASFVFPGIAASGVHAVVGLGLDSAQTKLVGGCVDIPGAALLEADTMRTTLILDHLFPVLSGTFGVSSDFPMNPPPLALAAIRSAWQQWQRCPYDPARLWLDCTLAALGSEPTSCLPSAASASPLAALVAAGRGTIVPPLPGALTSASDTPCHGALDGAGNPSIDVAVDALFTNARGQPPMVGLEAFPAELAALLDRVRLGSRLTLAPAAEGNSYWAEHELLELAFPGAISPLTLDVSVLALPVPAASGILATLKAGQLAVRNHAFTLRLGTAVRHAFETASLGARRAHDTDAFVEAVFSLAQLPDPRDALAGCAAFDAVVCDRLRQPRRCIEDACHAGLALLGRSLREAFASLDGPGLDFQLSGSAPVIDLDGDGRADALGLAGSAGGVAVGPGLWSAMIQTRAGTQVSYGAWLAAR